MQFDWWTLALQAVNVLVLVWLLGHFFYRPVVAMIEKRQAEAQKMLLDADAALAAAQKEQAEIAATRKGFSAEHDRLLESARKEADAARAALLDDARKQADALRAADEARWQRERAAAEDVLLHRASALAIDIARRLMERLGPDAATDLFVDSICGSVSRLSEQSRALLASAAEHAVPITVTSAAALNENQRQRVSQALETAAARKLAIAFDTDAALIAGIHIQGAEITIDDSWKNDLDHLLKELTGHAAAAADA